jgi:hypothetical protein
MRQKVEGTQVTVQVSRDAQLKVVETLNNQHRTPNIEGREFRAPRSEFSVQRSMF